MTIFGVIEMLGGLALFLYGMNVLGDALREASGGKLEAILEKLTSNKWKAAILGCGVTAIIQSSGATVVMVVGLVNSGIMTLYQAVGVILGANVGTTVTAWILSLTGISSDNVALALCKPENFAPIVAFIAVAMIMFSKKDKLHKAATIMIGFAILMIGMTTMSGAFSPLADNPKFTGILTMFSDNPLMGLLAGLAVTAILQSSSASIGILQAISMSGTLTVGAAIPVLMGENIGSALTALLGAMGSSRNAKRAAWIQMLYCLMKTMVFMVLFYTLNLIIHFPFMGVITNPVMIAMIHSIFNITAVLCFLPFSDYLVKAVETLIPTLPAEKEEAKKLLILDEHFLDSPSFALEQSKLAVVDMAQLAGEALSLAINLIGNYSDEGGRRVEVLEETVDGYEDQLNSYLVKLANRALTDKDSRTLSILLHSINDYERITDHALNVMQAAQSLHQQGLSLTAKATEEVRVYSRAVLDILDMTTTAFTADNMDMARNVEPLEEVIDGINMEEKKRHVYRLRKGKCSIEAGTVLSDISTDFERIADHCSNIAVDMLQVNEEGFDVHSYLEREKHEDTEEFEKRVKEFEVKYTLPPMGRDLPEKELPAQAEKPAADEEETVEKKKKNKDAKSREKKLKKR